MTLEVTQMKEKRENNFLDKEELHVNKQTRRDRVSCAFIVKRPERRWLCSS